MSDTVERTVTIEVGRGAVTIHGLEELPTVCHYLSDSEALQALNRAGLLAAAELRRTAIRVDNALPLPSPK